MLKVYWNSSYPYCFSHLDSRNIFGIQLKIPILQISNINKDSVGYKYRFQIFVNPGLFFPARAGEALPRHVRVAQLRDNGLLDLILSL